MGERNKVVQNAGIEPAPPVWKTGVLPLNEFCAREKKVLVVPENIQERNLNAFQQVV